MRSVIVAAVGRNGVIGLDGQLPWRIPEDLARFKRLTMGHILVMGRATFESIGRPLPGRSTIVLTRRTNWTEPGVEVAGSLEAALSLAAALRCRVRYFTDGVVIGSALVRLLAEQDNVASTCRVAGEFVASVRESLYNRFS